MWAVCQFARQAQQPSSSYLAILLAAAWFAAALPLWQCRQCVIPQSVWDIDIPGHWLASGPWVQCAAIRAFPILQNQIRRFLCCRNLRPFHSSPHNVIHGAVSLLPRRAFTAGENVQFPCIDWSFTDAGVWFIRLTAKSLSQC